MIAELGTSRLSDAVSSSTENLSKHYEEHSCSDNFLGISIMKQGLLLPEGVGQVIQSNQNNTLASLGSKVFTIVRFERSWHGKQMTSIKINILHPNRNKQKRDNYWKCHAHSHGYPLHLDPLNFSRGEPHPWFQVTSDQTHPHKRYRKQKQQQKPLRPYVHAC